MQRLARRAVLLVATALVVLTTAPAQAAPATRPDLAAAWLAGQLSNGLMHNSQYDFDDYGLTADAAFALVAVGGQDAAVTSISDALATNVDLWTTYGKDVYAGATAKALVLAELTGSNPRSFGGVNLVHRLSNRVGTTAPNVGRIRDKAATDYANVVGQALAARGLAVAHDSTAPSAVRFLLKQQCSSGYFRLNFAPRSASRQTCDAGDPQGLSAPDTDATAIAVLSLQALPKQGTRTKEAIADAVRWLKRHQRDNGSFGGGTTTQASNANSTGLAAWALGQAHACGAAQDAARWIRRVQVSGDVSSTPLAGQEGAIAYDRTAFAAGQDNGIRTKTRDQWRRATAQAAPALAYLSLDTCRAG